MVEVVDPLLTLAYGGPLFDAQQALADRLELAFPSRQFNHQVVPARLSKPVWDSLVKRTPFVGRGFVGLTPPPEGSGRIYHAHAAWTVFLGVQNRRLDGLLLGDKGGALGQLGIVGLAVALLHGYVVRGLGTWRVGNVTNLYAEDWVHDDTALSAVEVSINLEVVDEDAAAALPEFLRVGITWNLPPIDGDISIENVRTP